MIIYIHYNSILGSDRLQLYKNTPTQSAVIKVAPESFVLVLMQKNDHIMLMVQPKDAEYNDWISLLTFHLNSG